MNSTNLAPGNCSRTLFIAAATSTLLAVLRLTKITPAGLSARAGTGINKLVLNWWRHRTRVISTRPIDSRCPQCAKLNILQWILLFYVKNACCRNQNALKMCFHLLWLHHCATTSCRSVIDNGLKVGNTNVSILVLSASPHAHIPANCYSIL